MPYREFDERLQQVLDERHCPDADARLREIASVDETVAARLRAAELIASPTPPRYAPSPDFADRILKRIREEDLAETRARHAPIWKRPAFWMTGLGLTTAALVMFALSLPRASNEPEGIAATSSDAPLVAEKGASTTRLASGEPVATTFSPWDSQRALAGISKQLDVRQEKVVQLQSGLKPLRSTFNVTIHVLRSTVPNRTPSPSPQRRPQTEVEGEPSSAIPMMRWYV